MYDTWRWHLVGVPVKFDSLRGSAGKNWSNKGLSNGLITLGASVLCSISNMAAIADCDHYNACDFTKCAIVPFRSIPEVALCSAPQNIHADSQSYDHIYCSNYSSPKALVWPQLGCCNYWSNSTTEFKKWMACPQSKCPTSESPLVGYNSVWRTAPVRSWRKRNLLLLLL